MTSLVQTLSKSKTVVRIAFLASLGLASGAQNLMAQAAQADFDLKPNPKVVAAWEFQMGPRPRRT